MLQLYMHSCTNPSCCRAARSVQELRRSAREPQSTEPWGQRLYGKTLVITAIRVTLLVAAVRVLVKQTCSGYVLHLSQGDASPLGGPLEASGEAGVSQAAFRGKPVVLGLHGK
jgi:hypothetical protein